MMNSGAFLCATRRCARWLALMAGVMAACLPAWTQTYTITDLGSLGGYSQGFAINSSGQVAGISATPTNSFGHVFLISPPYTSMIDLGATGRAQFYSFGAGINDSGQVTGGALSDVFVISPPYTSMLDLGNFGGVFSSNGGYGINASGQITGLSFLTGSSPFDPYHAFVSNPPYSGLTDLGTLGGTSSSGAGINSSGQIVGTSLTTGDAARHAFVISPPYTTMIDLGDLGGHISDGFGINDAGMVTGESFVPVSNGNVYHAYVISPPYTTMIDIGTLGGNYGTGRGINNFGQVVGTSFIADGSSHAFIYTRANGMVDLNTLIPSGSGWTLIAGMAINDSGLITGYGINPNGDQHAFVLTPSSAPTPTQMVTNLMRTIQGLNLQKTGASFNNQLQQVLTDISTQNGLACSDLNAFANHVSAQSGKALSLTEANQLLGIVASIESALNCGP